MPQMNGTRHCYKLIAAGPKAMSTRPDTTETEVEARLLRGSTHRDLRS